jgi:hypothetical protein
LTTAPSQSLSLVDILSQGYRVLNQHIWVLLWPVLLGLLLWATPRLSLAPLLQLARDESRSFMLPLSADPQQQEALFVQLQNLDMRAALAFSNYLPVLAPQTVDAANPLTGSVPGMFSVGTPGQFVLALLLINSGALILSSFFLAALAQAWHRPTFSWRRYLGLTLRGLYGIGGYLLILLGAMVIFSVPFALGFAAVAQRAPALSGLLVLIWWGVWFWLYIHTGFAVEAVLLNRVNPLRGIAQSVLIVRRFFWKTLAFLALSLLILRGLSIIWGGLSDSLPGVLGAVLGQAYVGSGLAAARFIFYREHLAGVVAAQQREHEA